MNAVKNSDTPTTDKAVETMQDILNQITTRAAEAETRIRDAVHDAEGDIRSKTHDAQKNAKALADNIEDYVHQHPMQALGIAFVGGLLLSSMMKR
jgi:ElaB/YqjD/DUF883 family membrane-anchored ribosome-binding protein